MKEITIDGVTYIPKVETDTSGMKYCIVRTYSAGVFAGYLESQIGQEVTLRNARRIWSWAGAATLSQLAASGTSKPGECKFPEPVERITLTQAIEIIECSPVAIKSIQEVKVWKA